MNYELCTSLQAQKYTTWKFGENVALSLYVGNGQKLPDRRLFEEMCIVCQMNIYMFSALFVCRDRSVTCCGQIQMTVVAGVSRPEELATRSVKTSQKRLITVMV